MTKRILASASASAMGATLFRPGISAPLKSCDGGANARAAPYYLRRRGGEQNRACCRSGSGASLRTEADGRLQAAAFSHMSD